MVSFFFFLCIVLCLVFCEFNMELKLFVLTNNSGENFWKTVSWFEFLGNYFHNDILANENICELLGFFWGGKISYMLFRIVTT